MTKAVFQNPYLHGEFAPVVEELTKMDLTVDGELPKELVGRYFRNGPNPYGKVDENAYHWFTGHGMLHGIRLNEGRAEWYKNRFVRAPELCALLGEKSVPNPWPAEHRTFSANTSIIKHAGKFFAIVEAGAPPVEMTGDLDTVCISNLDGTLPGGFSAHPILDPKTGECHVMAYFWVNGNAAQYIVVGRDGRVRKSLAIPLPGAPMIHSTAITERYVLVFDLPCVFNVEAAMRGAQLPYLWDKNYQARAGLLPREGTVDDIRWCEVDSCFVFHTMNAYDAPDGSVIVDVVRHPRMFATDLHGPWEGDPLLERWVLDPKSGKTKATQLDDRPIEFPRINETYTGCSHRYGYADTLLNSGGLLQRGIVKYDFEKGSSEAHDEGEGFGYGEAVFIPRKGAQSEDDGWLMALRLNRAENRSDLVILNAQDMKAKPLAVVHLPARVPYGFHGNWFSDNS